jgi:dipeptidyl aminopeptidase/acylaminoacyl peptidase
MYVMATPTSAPKRLTEFNAWATEVGWGTMERVTWKGPNGFDEDGTLTLPPGFSPSNRYPLVLLIHGGPTSASKLSFSSLAQLMAAEGWVVFSPNYRGSDNLGNAYQAAIVGDAGSGPGKDVMAGVAMLRQRPYVDKTKTAVTGWSYGGYMTSWLIGHYNFWKVAVAGAPVTDLYEEYNLSDGNVGGRYSFKGSPYVGDNLKDYRAQSPITYWANIKTPTLLLHDVGDARVTITQSYSLFHALKDNNVEVKFFAYPVGGHFPGDPVRQMDVFRRWSDWLDQHLK